MGLRTVGWDINSVCAEGTQKNLMHTGLLESSNTGFLYVATEDASLDLRFHKQRPLLGSHTDNLEGMVACVIANLPWGKNAADYYGHNEEMIHNLIRILHKSKWKGRKVFALVVPSLGTDAVILELQNKTCPSSTSMFRVHRILPLGSKENIVMAWC